MSLYTIPFPVGPLHYSVVVVLQDENIARIKERDPAEVVTRDIVAALGEPFTWMTLRDVIITYATDEELVKVGELLAQEKLREALQFLTRGYRFRPDQGDGLPVQLKE